MMNMKDINWGLVFGLALVWLGGIQVFAEHVEISYLARSMLTLGGGMVAGVLGAKWS